MYQISKESQHEQWNNFIGDSFHVYRLTLSDTFRKWLKSMTSEHNPYVADMSSQLDNRTKC